MKKLSIALLCTLASFSINQALAQDVVVQKNTTSYKDLAEITKVRKFETIETGSIIHKRLDGTCYEREVTVANKREAQVELGTIVLFDLNTTMKDIRCP